MVIRLTCNRHPSSLAMFLIPCCKNLDHQSGSNITRQPETAMSAQMSHQHCVHQSGQTTVASGVPEGLARISGSIKETPCDRIQSGYGRQKAGFEPTWWGQ